MVNRAARRWQKNVIVTGFQANTGTIIILDGQMYSGEFRYTYQDLETGLVFEVGDGYTFGHPRQPLMDQVLLTSNAHLTERGDPATNMRDTVVAGDIEI